MRSIATALLLVASLSSSGCLFLGGAAVGATGAGAAYEYRNKRDMDALDRDFRRGRISQQEYLQRKQEIEKRSLIR